MGQVRIQPRVPQHRYLGLITGTSVMGAVFALASAARGSQADAAAVGLQVTFGVAAVLIALALASKTAFVRLLNRPALDGEAS